MKQQFLMNNFHNFADISFKVFFSLTLRYRESLGHLNFRFFYCRNIFFVFNTEFVKVVAKVGFVIGRWKFRYINWLNETNF